MFHAQGRTDMTELIVAFHNFAKAPKITWLLSTVLKSRLYPFKYDMKKFLCNSWIFMFKKNTSSFYI
jgi:hypothetical protein